MALFFPWMSTLPTTMQGCVVGSSFLQWSSLETKLLGALSTYARVMTTTARGPTFAPLTWGCVDPSSTTVALFILGLTTSDIAPTQRSGCKQWNFSKVSGAFSGCLPASSHLG